MLVSGHVCVRGPHSGLCLATAWQLAHPQCCEGAVYVPQCVTRSCLATAWHVLRVPSAWLHKPLVVSRQETTLDELIFLPSYISSYATDLATSTACRHSSSAPLQNHNIGAFYCSSLRLSQSCLMTASAPQPSLALPMHCCLRLLEPSTYLSQSSVLRRSLPHTRSGGVTAFVFVTNLADSTACRHSSRTPLQNHSSEALCCSSLCLRQSLSMTDSAPQPALALQRHCCLSMSQSLGMLGPPSMLTRSGGVTAFVFDNALRVCRHSLRSQPRQVCCRFTNHKQEAHQCPLVHRGSSSFLSLHLFWQHVSHCGRRAFKRSSGMVIISDPIASCLSFIDRALTLSLLHIQFEHQHVHYSGYHSHQSFTGEPCICCSSVVALHLSLRYQHDSYYEIYASHRPSGHVYICEPHSGIFLATAWQLAHPQCFEGAVYVP